MEHRRIIKHGAVVVATQEDGSIDPTGPFSQGLFVGDTRFLSRFRIYLDGLAPSLMGSGEETLYQAGYLQTNPALPHVPARSFGLVQRTAIENGVVTITLAVRNMTVNPLTSNCRSTSTRTSSTRSKPVGSSGRSAVRPSRRRQQARASGFSTAAGTT
jgi:hypothetical protein